jgi:cytochrome c peroxidase
MITRNSQCGICVLLLALWSPAALVGNEPVEPMLWSPTEVALLRSLWIGSLSPLPADPGNAVADNPKAATLGQRLFFERRFSANGAVSCATCHQPERYFTDGLALSKGVGTTTRNSMTLVGAAYSPWYFWDGRKDSAWSQALGPLENPLEHGGNRLQAVRLLAEDQHYRIEYQALFGPLPDFSEPSRFPDAAGPTGTVDEQMAWKTMSRSDQAQINRAFANLGKAIAAYERLLLPGAARFDGYVQALLENDSVGMNNALTQDEAAGLRLFIGKGQCIRCHNGPLFTNHEFHNTGVPARQGLSVDQGRVEGAAAVLADPFNCLGEYSDADPDVCAELRFRKSGTEMAGAFKTPTLRNVAQTAPYMHAGQFATLEQVLRHYNRAAPGPVGHSELEPLQLSTLELTQLEAFLGSLSADIPSLSNYATWHNRSSADTSIVSTFH